MNKLVISVIAGMSMMIGSLALAADAPNIAVANTARIFSEMQELKELQAKLSSERELLAGVNREKRQKLEALQAARDALKSDTPQYKEKNAELLKAAIEYETWSKLNQVNFEREQKLQMKSLFEKIEAAVAEVARQKKIALVITDHRPELPENLDALNMDQLRGLINARTVLYAGENVDISNDVLALLDARYRSGGSSTKPQ